MASHEYTFRLISELEKDLFVCFNIDSIRLFCPWFTKKSASYQELPKIIGGNVVSLPRNASGKDLKELLYHELGHALLSSYGVPKRLVSSFNSIQSSDGVFGHICYLVKSGIYARAARSKNFVSGYAKLDSEEDFCETFSSFIMNRKSKRFIKYDGNVIDLAKEPVLKKKLASVRKIIFYCSQRTKIKTKKRLVS